MSKTNKIILWLVAIIVVVGLIWLGYSEREIVEEGEVIKIGFIGALSGDAASVGQSALAAAEFAVKELNDKGGVLGKQIELVIEDDQCIARGGSDAMNRLVNIEQVIAISGPDCGSAAGSSIPIAQKAGVPVVIRWASVPNLPKIGDYIFRIYPSDAFQGAYASDYIYNKLNKNKVAVLYVRNIWGQGLRDVFVKEFEKLGGEIVYEDSFVQENLDFKSMLAKMKTKNPEAIFLPSYRYSGVVALKQIKELGINIPVIGGDAFDADEVITNPAGEGVMFPVATVNNPDNFKDEVLKVIGRKADQTTGPLSYDSIVIIAEAIERAGSLNQEKIKEELKKTSYKGVSYQLIEFDEYGDIKYTDYEMRIIKNGESIPYEIQ